MARQFFLILSVLLALTVTVMGGSADVVILGDSDFDSKLAALDNTLVMFYAPW